MKANLESHESATVSVSNFTALVGTTMADYTNSTSVAPGFAGLRWHPNITGPRTTVASIGGNGENILFTLPWLNQNMLH